ncbi:hypothetical protein Hamer_G024651, partial [Homarus americanus]
LTSLRSRAQRLTASSTTQLITRARESSDTISPDYSIPAPWESPPAIYNILKSGTSKADWNTHELRQVAERHMKAVTPHNSIVYYTDGSVESSNTKAGEAFTIKGGGMVL